MVRLLEYPNSNRNLVRATVKKITQYIHSLIRQLRNKIITLKLFILTFFCSLSSGPYVVVENYGNWRTLSFTSKSAYITGLWDSYITFFGDDTGEIDNANCTEDVVTRVADLVEVVDSLYVNEINRSISPAILLKNKVLNQLCGN